MNSLLTVLAVTTFAAGGLINILIGLLVLALIIYVVYWILGMIPMPAPMRNIVVAILAIIFILVLLSRLGIMI